MPAPKGLGEQKLSLLGLLDEFVMTVLTLHKTLLILMSKGTAHHEGRQATSARVAFSLRVYIIFV